MFTDSHVHLDFDVFDKDRSAVIARARKLGVERFLIPGVSAAHWPKQLEIAEQFSQCLVALGIHPWFVSDCQPPDIAMLESHLRSNTNVLAVGEIGLDWHIDTCQKLQTDIFEQQLTLAAKYNKPVILHHRKSHDQIAKLLRHYKLARGGVIHAFSGSYQQACAYLDLGFKLGIGGTITYERAKKTRAVISRLPIESFLVETDSPDMPVAGKQGERNEPAFLVDVLKVLLALTGTTKHHLESVLEDNFNQLFLPE